MQNLIFIEIQESLNHLIEEEQESIILPFLSHKGLETTHFVVRSNKYIAANVSVIETVEKVQDILRVRL